MMKRDPADDTRGPGDAAAAAGDHADEPRQGISRRAMIATAAAAAGGALTADVARAARTVTGRPQQAPDPTKIPGDRPQPVGQRSPHERPQKIVTGSAGGVSLTPHQDLHGIITPADLHFERHHHGTPAIDPATYRLMIHGMVDRPLMFTLEDLKRFPTVSRFHFLECSGNGRGASADPPRGGLTPQQVDGLLSGSEWTGVPLSILFREVGVHEAATWFLAEGSDAAVMSRSIPVEKAWEDAMIAYGQNGEAIRPEQGYPARLFLPGWEGNANVKWIRRIELSDRPFMTRDETSRYTDPLKDGTARIFSFVMDAKSLITRPSYPNRLEPGFHEVNGMAWSGRGLIDRVEVSTDGGDSWTEATLDEPVLPRCLTRFRYGWEWNGGPAHLLSRAIDETGYVQPGRAQLRDARGRFTRYHYNSVRGWRVAGDGRVEFAPL